MTTDFFVFRNFDKSDPINQNIALDYEKRLYFQIGNHKQKKNICIAFYIVLFLLMHFGKK